MLKNNSRKSSNGKSIVTLRDLGQARGDRSFRDGKRIIKGYQTEVPTYSTKNSVMCASAGKCKHLFKSETAALNFMKFNNETIEETKGYAPKRAYRCTSCCGWHLTSKEDRRTSFDRSNYKHLDDFSKVEELLKSNDLLSKQLVQIKMENELLKQKANKPKVVIKQPKDVAELKCELNEAKQKIYSLELKLEKKEKPTLAQVFTSWFGK